ncbi:MAG TPA: hypothetical protein VNJ54_01880 [Plantibacter sp.]|uniref:hypothetical protein n=1 Tax=unclassified Plantibacter TaxID=2624265 RepID=UPI002BD313BB|nr:hypothetical protein [Plantibacter sp.]
MPLFSRRKPTPGDDSGAPARATDEPEAFSVPAPIFAPVPEPESSSGADVPPSDGPPDGPRDPNAPPVPGAPPRARADALAEPAREPTEEEIEARTARFGRPGSRRRGTTRRPSARQARKRAAREAKAAVAAPPVVNATPHSEQSEPTAEPPASTSTRARGAAFLSPRALLLATIVLGLLAILLVVLFEPGATAWAVVGALILIGVVQLTLFYASIVVITRKASRRLGVLALVLLIAINPLTATMVRGIVSGASGDGYSAGGSRDGDDDHDPIWDTYPGSAYVDAKDTLDGPSYEEFGDESDTMLEEIRTALTAEFGFEWVERQPSESEIDHNGYGGDSMLYEYTAPIWQTTTTVRTFEEKSRVVEIIRQVLLRHGIANLDMQNAPASWREPGELTEQYGGETIDTQALWELHTYDTISRAGSFQASIVDLTLDSAGTVTKDRQFDIDYYDMAAEGIELHLDAYALLKEADRADYLEALKPYADLDKPE